MATTLSGLPTEQSIVLLEEALELEYIVDSFEEQVRHLNCE